MAYKNNSRGIRILLLQVLLVALLNSTSSYEISIGKSSFPAIKINNASRKFVDEFGRERIFHGVNAVYKIAPWLPSTEKFDSTESLSRDDAELMRSWGFNVVRLGVMWPGLEPNIRGQYDYQYLDNVQQVVQILADASIYVLLDLHQDLWHREYCGEGVPDYLQSACQTLEPNDTQPFPLPAVNTTYPDDAAGVPAIESCLSVMFATYYMSAEVGAGFQCLYDNKAESWEAIGGYWREVVKKFSKATNVLGYELINEPWAGDVYDKRRNLLPQYAEKNYLAPLYSYLHDVIREIDLQKIIFFEGLTIDFWPNGFEEGPGGPEFNDRQALAYHIYCPVQDPTDKSVAGCDRLNRKFFNLRKDDAARLGVPMIMTEFGATEDIPNDIAQLLNTMTMADEGAQSWMYWQYKYYNDITTCTPEGEALFYTNGTVCESKLRALSRTYPMAVAGTIVNFVFDTETAVFTLSYIPLAEISASQSDALTTEIYFNAQLFYPTGANVELVVSSADMHEVDYDAYFSVICSAVSDGGGIVKILQTSSLPSNTSISVEVTVLPCDNEQLVCLC